jgi:hypothetical protein
MIGPIDSTRSFTRRDIFVEDVGLLVEDIESTASERSARCDAVPPCGNDGRLGGRMKDSNASFSSRSLGSVSYILQSAP